MSLPVTVRILGKEYQVACPAEEREALESSAALLDGKMREIRDAGKIVGLDRIAVLAALNLANDVVKLNGAESKDKEDVGRQLENLTERVAVFLEEAQQVEI